MTIEEKIKRYSDIAHEVKRTTLYDIDCREEIWENFQNGFEMAMNLIKEGGYKDKFNINIEESILVSLLFRNAGNEVLIDDLYERVETLEEKTKWNGY